MKKYLNLTYAILLTLSVSVKATESNINSITLNDSTIISGNEITGIFNDYLELKEGTRIESTEIKEIKFKNQSNFRNSTETQTLSIKRGGGEESGG